MAKQIKVTHNGEQYTLEYTRKTIEAMERGGFSISNVQTKPMSTLPALFAGAFLAHHRNVMQNKIDKIFAAQKNKEQLVEKLAEMYNEPIVSLLDDPEENEGNAEWETNW